MHVVMYIALTTLCQPQMHATQQPKQPCNYTNKVVQPSNSTTQGCSTL